MIDICYCSVKRYIEITFRHALVGLPFNSEYTSTTKISLVGPNELAHA